MTFDEEDVGRYFLARGALWRCIAVDGNHAVMDRMEIAEAVGRPAKVRLIPKSHTPHGDEFERIEQWLPGDMRPRHKE